ncbi:hypothetical protein B0T25DRAFT_219403 [Lasiosphaeria hispida]|uniref:Nephrocystin 3-like N-terminal domain-containing protein n=1 Tax=Lasiosphaeria hispida TaxID=260671 RepID=A0AAJ0HJ88_9PEZI|nr:hypothetical protein B0T25DRAFT_219403 [Lasiosphaeria hispida]
MSAVGPQTLDLSHGIQPAAARTCKWLLQHKKYGDWTSRDRSLLWIKGKPGAGKSTLLKHALEAQEAAYAGRDDIILSFFHARGDELQKSPLGFFRFLLYQIMDKTPGALRSLVYTFETKRRDISEPGDH